MVTAPQLAPPALALTYVVPLWTARGEPVDDLAAYLRDLAPHVGEVLVVDGSEPDVVAAHRAAFGPAVCVLRPEMRTLVGKVGNVLTGLRHARFEAVVIADDDVRYRRTDLVRARALLDAADVVRPQNYFAPLPWHARVDTARTLLNRVFGGDWPGTLVVRRSALSACGGYAGDVLFENLELVRTIRAAGGRETLALDLLVERRPPTSRHYRSQQIRQAYDELARPHRLAGSMLLLPAALVLVARRQWRVIVVATLAVIGVAEVGRRRAGGHAVFARSSVLLAPPWLLWRSLCSWAAVVARWRGGVRYRGVRVRRAATPLRVLRSRGRGIDRPAPHDD